MDFVEVVDGIDCSGVPILKALRGTRREDESTCLTGNSGDLV